MKIVKATSFEEEERYEGESDATFVNRLNDSLKYWNKILSTQESEYMRHKNQADQTSIKMRKTQDNISMIEERLGRASRLT